MKLRRVVLHALLLALPAGSLLARDLGGPQRNLLVELRWVESSVSLSVVAGLREGAVVVGTAGSVSPRGSITLGTQDHQDKQIAIQRLRVLNGFSASVSLGESTPVQWLDYALDLPASGASAGGGARLLAAPRTTLVERSSGFSVSPHWPGGAAPVRVQFSVHELTPGTPSPSASEQTRVLSTVSMPLHEWTVVARSGKQLQASERGVLRSRDAESVGMRELQLRVSLAP